MKIIFSGSTDEVSGSKTFLETPEDTIMIDCGLFQGTPEVNGLNKLPLPVEPSKISAIIITHAHLDHSGYLPRLVKKGYKGPIYCTPATAKLARIILLDSAKLNEDHFYDEKDVQETLKLVKTHDWNTKFNINDTQLEFLPVAHILGASSVMIKHGGKRILFSGDLGRKDDSILPPLTNAPEADVIIMESTYGGRNRTGDMHKELHQFLTTISRESRIGIIASFAVARAQNLLTLIHEFYQRHPEEKVRVVIDSPMMKEANRVYKQYAHLTLIPDTVYDSLNEIDSIDFEGEWKSLKKKSGPLIIISSSGMLTGGRIGRHLMNWHDDRKAILFMPGYQAEGTPGRSFVDGNRKMIGPKDEFFNWSGEVWNSDAFSSHADQSELIEWISTNNNSSKVFLIHGAEESKKVLKEKLLLKNFKQVEIPASGSVYEV